MKKLLVKKVDAFTDTPLAGNPAGVVHGADALADPVLQAIARELNLGETAFVLSPEEDGVDFDLRYFSPSAELGAGGPAILAAYHSLIEEKTLKVGGTNRFTHMDKAGRHEVEIRPRGSFEQIVMTMDRPSFGPEFEEPDRAAKVLGVEEKQLNDDLPLQLMNDETLVVPVDSLATLEKLAPDLDAIRKMQRKDKVRHLLAFSKETQEMASNYHMRLFAPSTGVDEDPVSAVGHARLSGYLVRHKVVKTTSGLANLTGEQGHFMGRAGKVTVEVRSEGQVIREVRVGGTAVTSLRGEVQVP